jgi:hypothetical protein
LRPTEKKPNNQNQQNKTATVAARVGVDLLLHPRLRHAGAAAAAAAGWKRLQGERAVFFACACTQQFVWRGLCRGMCALPKQHPAAADRHSTQTKKKQAPWNALISAADYYAAMWPVRRCD